VSASSDFEAASPSAEAVLLYQHEVVMLPERMGSGVEVGKGEEGKDGSRAGWARLSALVLKLGACQSALHGCAEMNKAVVKSRKSTSSSLSLNQLLQLLVLS
jgi:hypothetical protein